MVSQVVFADTTQILLSEEGRVVTFVDAARNRHTLTLCSIFQEQRWALMLTVYLLSPRGVGRICFEADV